MNTINIAKLIDNNSMTRLSKDYENIMINKINKLLKSLMIICKYKMFF